MGCPLPGRLPRTKRARWCPILQGVAWRLSLRDPPFVDGCTELALLMLHRNMKHLTPNQKLGLEDLLGDLWHARRRGDLGRLALLSYYEVRRWARMAGEPELAEHSSVLVTKCPHP